MKKYRRRQYLSLLFLTLLLLIFIRYFLLKGVSHPQSPAGAIDLFLSLADKLIVAVMAALAAAISIPWLFGDADGVEGSRTVYPSALKLGLEQSLHGTSEFYYRGHTGRWTRFETLPKLAGIAQKKGSRIKVVLLLSDPECEAVCKAYSEYVFHESTGNGKPFDSKKTSMEIFSTIVSALYWSKRCRYLDVSIGLTGLALLTRVDLSSSGLFITTPNPRAPALYFSSDSPHYDVIKEDINIVFNQSKIKLGSQDALDVFGDAKIDAESVRNLLSTLGFDTSTLGEKDFSYIARSALSPVNPYPH